MVKIFSSKGCMPCVEVKKFLDMRKVEYKVVDRDEDNASDEMMRLSGRVITPLIVSDKGMVVGADFAKIASIL